MYSFSYDPSSTVDFGSLLLQSKVQLFGSFRLFKFLSRPPEVESHFPSGRKGVRSGRSRLQAAQAQAVQNSGRQGGVGSRCVRSRQSLEWRRVGPSGLPLAGRERGGGGNGTKKEKSVGGQIFLVGRTGKVESASESFRHCHIVMFLWYSTYLHISVHCRCSVNFLVRPQINSARKCRPFEDDNFQLMISRSSLFG